MDTDLTELGKALHARLLAGDVTASAEIAELFFQRVLHLLRKRYPRLDDPHLVDTAVEDAFLSYFDRPAQYDPAKLPLASYLRMSANGDVLNRLKKPQAEMNSVSLDQIVELHKASAEYQLADDFDLESIVIGVTAPMWQRLAELLPDPIDQEVLLLMMEGVHATEVYAMLLGISDRPAEEQAAIVKRQKDRVYKVVRRGINPSELKENG